VSAAALDDDDDDDKMLPLCVVSVIGDLI